MYVWVTHIIYICVCVYIYIYTCELIRVDWFVKLDAVSGRGGWCAIAPNCILLKAPNLPILEPKLQNSEANKAKTQGYWVRGLGCRLEGFALRQTAPVEGLGFRVWTIILKHCNPEPNRRA